MRPGRQLFPLNYSNIIDDSEMKYKIKTIKLIIKESYGGNRTYINQIMFYEQTAEEVNELISGSELMKIYKNKKKIISNYEKNQKSRDASKLSQMTYPEDHRDINISKITVTNKNNSDINNIPTNRSNTDKKNNLKFPTITTSIDKKNNDKNTIININHDTINIKKQKKVKKMKK